MNGWKREFVSLVGWNEHTIDDVDDAVAGSEVGSDDFGATVQCHSGVVDNDVYIATLLGCRLGQSDNGCREWTICERFMSD